MGRHSKPSENPGPGLVAAIMSLALTVAAIAGCSNGPNATLTPVPTITVDNGVITVDEDYTGQWDAHPGDWVNVRMNPTGDPQARCDHMGGWLDGTLCVDVDF